MKLIELARKLRPLIEKAVQSLDDTEALESVTLYPEWKPKEHYIKGYRVRYLGILYAVLQNHESHETWTPDATPSLFAKALIPDEDDIPEWQQPDSTNGYMTGDKVRYNGIVYESRIDNNIWSPEAYPAGWKAVEVE